MRRAPHPPGDQSASACVGGCMGGACAMTPPRQALWTRRVGEDHGLPIDEVRLRRVGCGDGCLTEPPTDLLKGIMGQRGLVCCSGADQACCCSNSCMYATNARTPSSGMAL